MHQLILFNKPKKKLNSKMMMDYFTPQTKHPLNEFLSHKNVTRI